MRFEMRVPTKPHFEMGGIDHKLLDTAALCSQFGQNAVEYAQPRIDNTISVQMLQPLHD